MNSKSLVMNEVAPMVLDFDTIMIFRESGWKVRWLQQA
jgi:hypothetical protein